MTIMQKAELMGPYNKATKYRKCYYNNNKHTIITLETTQMQQIPKQ
jgi:hypothetical protein